MQQPKTEKKKRGLTQITNWKLAAWTLYRKHHGLRCLVCSKLVDFEDADMYTMEGIDEVIIKHLGCDD